MQQRLTKLAAIRARWQAQQKRLQMQLQIAKQALVDIDQQRAALQQLRLDYRQQRSVGTAQSPMSLALLARFDSELSRSLARLEEPLAQARQQVEARQAALLRSERKLLGLARYRTTLQHSDTVLQRQRQRRRQNQVPWRGVQEAPTEPSE